MPTRGIQNHHQKKVINVLVVSPRSEKVLLIRAALADDVAVRIHDVINSANELLDRLQGEQSDFVLVETKILRKLIGEQADELSLDEGGGLSARQLSILEQIGKGLNNREIATALSISEDTVKFHLKSIMAQFSVRSRSEAVAEAIRRGLIK